MDYVLLPGTYKAKSPKGAKGSLDLSYIIKQHVAAAGVSAKSWNEAPQGTIDGINQDYTVVFEPIAGKHSLYVNGVKQKQSAYSVTGNSLHLNFAPAGGDDPDELLFDYEYNP